MQFFFLFTACLAVSMCIVSKKKNKKLQEMCMKFCSCTFIFLALLFTFLQISNESVVLLTDIMQQAYNLNFILYFAFFFICIIPIVPHFCLWYQRRKNCWCLCLEILFIIVIAINGECETFHRILWMIFYRLCKWRVSIMYDFLEFWWLVDNYSW